MPELDPVALARRFVDIPSLTGGEAGMAAACAAELELAGFAVQRLPVQGERANVLAMLGPPRVLLCTHLDTVPPHLPARDDGDWLYGRGACDAKGILAAMLAAASGLRQDGVDDVGLLFVVGEETDSIGAKHANATLDLPSVRYTIVGEPTDSRFARAQKGGFKFTLRARGKAAHSGYPEQGRSAVLKLLDVLLAVRDADWGADAELGRGTANIGVVRGGTAANIVPDVAEAEVHVRVVDSTSATRARLERLLAASSVDVEWSLDTASDPQRLVTLPGAPETVVAFNTDVPHLERFGRKLLVGPGSILVAHGDGERISKTELRAAVDLYRSAVLHLRGACG
jgi:acetylornithine deacetylase